MTVFMQIRFYNIMRYSIMHEGYLSNRINRLAKMFGP